jgi:hypothetical protein
MRLWNIMIYGRGVDTMYCQQEPYRH